MQACAKEAFLIGLSQFSDVSSGVSSEMSSDTPNECVLSSGNTYKRLRKRLSTSDDGLLFSEAQGFRHALSAVSHLLATQDQYAGLRHGLRYRETYVSHHRKRRDSR